jgi:mannose-1-phosphate guanylyltransferase/mannose-6-phosphate isomerase
MHYHRSEHWVVVRGAAKVKIGDKEIFIHENESAYVPKSTLHRLENPGKVPLEIIEVQNGEYVGEDDIVRVEDVYGRQG